VAPEPTCSSSYSQDRARSPYLEHLIALLTVKGRNSSLWKVVE